MAESGADGITLGSKARGPYPTTLTGEPDAPRGIAPVTERFRVTVELP